MTLVRLRVLAEKTPLDAVGHAACDNLACERAGAVVRLPLQENRPIVAPKDGEDTVPEGFQVWDCLHTLGRCHWLPFGHHHHSSSSATFSSCQQLLHDFSRDVRKPEIASLEPVGEPGVIEPHQVQHGGVKIMHRDWILYDVVANVVGSTNGDAWLDTAAREPHRESSRVMVPAEELRLVASFVHRCASKLAAPNNQR